MPSPSALTPLREDYEEVAQETEEEKEEEGHTGQDGEPGLESDTPAGKSC